MINVRGLAGADYSDRRKYVELYFEQSGNPAFSIYADSEGIPTIGIGFNLRDPNVLDEVLTRFLFVLTDPSDDSYKDRLVAVFAADTPATWQADANGIMAERAAAIGGNARTTFAFSNLTEVFATFDQLVVDYESTATTLGPDAANSYERLAIVDMAYNGVLDESNLFRTAWNAGDRAEAWFEIAFDTNAEQLSGILKRRYLEGELFGLYDSEDGTAGFRPSEAEALRVFRMFNKHELQVNGENAKVAAGSVVLHSVKSGCTVAGVPAKPVGDCAKSPAITMDQQID